MLALIVAVVGARRGPDRRAGRPSRSRTSPACRSTGFIAGSQRTANLLEACRRGRRRSGVVISINTPGGTTTGAEELYRNLRSSPTKKPLVAFVDGTAASGAYIAAIASDHIVARETSLVGSIGVMLQYPEVSELLGRIGITVEDIKSRPLKAEPSGVRPTPPEARAALQSVVNDTYEWFKGLVQSGAGTSARTSPRCRTAASSPAGRRSP